MLCANSVAGVGCCLPGVVDSGYCVPSVAGVVCPQCCRCCVPTVLQASGA